MKKIEQKKFRIGELAKQLEVETSVIRFWEKEFGIKATRSEGLQRFYTQKDLNKFTEIKDLLYNKKFTIAGAKESLKSKEVSKADENIKIIPSKLERQILELQEQLLKLKELL